MRPLRRKRDTPLQPPDAKPYRVTIHAAGDQQHTFAMAPGDAVGVGQIRVDILADGTVDVRPLEHAPAATAVATDTAERAHGFRIRPA